MKTIWKVLLPMFAVVTVFLVADARGDMAGPGTCFGGNDHNDNSIRKDAGGDGKDAVAQAAGRSDARRTGVGLLSAAFVTSGWLFFRRKS